MKKLLNKLDKPVIRKVALWSPAGISLIAVLIYMFLTSRAYFTSDAANLQILSEQVMKAKWIISSDFSYAEPRQILTLLSLPWLLFFPASLLGHSVTTAIFAIMFFCATIWTLKRLQLTPLAVSLTTALIFLSLSPLMAEMFWLQLVYGWESLFTILLLGLLLPEIKTLENTSDKHGQFRYLMLIFLTPFLFCFNTGSRPAMIYFLPVLIALLLYPFLRNDIQPWKYIKENKNILLTMTLGCLAGLFLLKITTRNFSFSVYKDALNTYSNDSLKNVLSLVPLQYLNITGGLPVENSKVASFSGLLHLSNALLAIGLAAILLCLTTGFHKLQKSSHRILILIAWITIIAVLYPFALSLSNHPDWRGVSRYLIPIVFILLIVFGIFIDYLSVNGRKWNIVILSLFLVLPFYHSTSFLVDFSGLTHNDPHALLADFLKKHGIYYGYSSYWHASVTTIRSASTVKIRPVIITDEIRQYPVHSAYSWYDPRQDFKKTFLVLDHDEEKSIISQESSSNARMILSKAKERLEYNGFVIYIFDFNIAQLMPQLPHPK